MGFLNVLELGASGDHCSEKLRCLSCTLLEVTMLNIILCELVSPVKFFYCRINVLVNEPPSGFQYYTYACCLATLTVAQSW